MIAKLLLSMLVLFTALHSESKNALFETVTRSGRWVVVAEKELKEKSAQQKIRMDKNLQKIDEIINYKEGLPKKRQREKEIDSLRFRTLSNGNIFEYRTKENITFRFSGDTLTFVSSFVSESRPQTTEEMLYFREHKKLPESWATVSVDSAKNIVTTFLQETLKVDDFELFDSLNVRHLDEGYLLSYSVRLGDFCGIRRHSVRINANTGEIHSYRAINDHYSDFEPGYVPKISRDEALRILKSDSRFVGVNVDFRKNEPEIDKNLDFEIAKVCLIPITMQHIQVSGKDGWVWRALLRIPDTTGILFDILIDSDTGDILYFDPGLGPRN